MNNPSDDILSNTDYSSVTESSTPEDTLSNLNYDTLTPSYVSADNFATSNGSSKNSRQPEIVSDL